MAALSQLNAIVFAEVAKPLHNQWKESAFLRAMESGGFVKRRAGGSALEFSIDYRKSPDVDFLATDFTATSTSQSVVLAGASYDMANLVSPINWSIADEARWSGDGNKKLNALKELSRNAIDSHDDEIELRAWSTSTDGFLGMQNLIPTSGQPNVGGIDGSSATYFRNFASTYATDGSDLNAKLITMFNTVSKGSGSELTPDIIASGLTAIGLYEGGLTDLKRFMGETTGDAGFKYLAFKTAKWVYSQHGGTLATNPIYALNKVSFNLNVTKGYFRKLEEAERYTNAAARNQMVFSQMQLTVANPSRLGVLYTA